jgi:acyl carrier protein
MNLEKLNTIINDIRKENDLAHVEITTSSELRSDLNMDSYDLAQLTVLIEAETGIDIFGKNTPEKISDILSNF